jgi:protein TonB
MKKLYFLLVAGLLLSGSAFAQRSPQPMATLTADAPAAGRLAAPAISPDSVFVNPDVLPQFTGGMPALQAFLAKNLRYPEQARYLHAKGSVYVRFMVNAQGRISDVAVLKGLGYGLNEEAQRLVWMMPTWQPGRHNGQAVRTACTLPISFQ